VIPEVLDSYPATSDAVFYISVVAKGVDHVSMELWIPTGPLSSPQIIHERIWSSGEIILRGENSRTRREKQFQYHFVHLRVHTDCPGSKPGSP
jgi:hypothetical protein